MLVLDRFQALRQKLSSKHVGCIQLAMVNVFKSGVRKEQYGVGELQDEEYWRHRFFWLRGLQTASCGLHC